MAERPLGRAAVAVGVVVGTGLAAPQPVQGQKPVEGMAQVLATTATRGALLAGPGIAWLPGRRDRLVIRSGIGLQEGGGTAGRVEAAWHLRLFPESRRPGAYLGGGVGVTWADSTRGVLVGLIGLDAKPSARQGWQVEIGVGGGFRAMVGYRLRL